MRAAGWVPPFVDFPETGGLEWRITLVRSFNGPEPQAAALPVAARSERGAGAGPLVCMCMRLRLQCPLLLRPRPRWRSPGIRQAPR
jgi:hypothetical protein